MLLASSALDASLCYCQLSRFFSPQYSPFFEIVHNFLLVIKNVECHCHHSYMLANIASYVS